MKIAIASDDEKNVASHIGRVRGFVIYEIEDKKIKNKEYRINDFTGHKRGLEGKHHIDHHAPIIEALKDCKAVISSGMGKRIYDDLKNAGFEVYITKESEVEKVVDLYINNKLVDYYEELVCHHKGH